MSTMPAAAEGGEMDERTLAALKGSIAKWEKIVAGEDGDRGQTNCALCREFIDQDCIGCPVWEATGLDGCEGTPFVALWVPAETPLGPHGYMAESPEAKAAAQAELDFLKSLLPEGARP